MDTNQFVVCTVFYLCRFIASGILFLPNAFKNGQYWCREPEVLINYHAH